MGNYHEIGHVCVSMYLCVCLSVYLCVCLWVCPCLGAFWNHWYGVILPGFPPDVAFFSVIWLTHWCGLQCHINVALKRISSSCLVLSQVLEVVSHKQGTPELCVWDTKVMHFEFCVLLGKHTASTIGCYSVAPSIVLCCGLLCLLYRYSTIIDFVAYCVSIHTFLWHTLLQVLRQVGKCITKNFRMKLATSGIS